ncbi:alkaline phosphatase family protein [Dyella nitratireducens]|uniref:Alkaline phosphatase family protein n=1 Tax=Dyella nitratireducens TaxID=1849580 RepID=A0ABQ1G715_9GAMM|nr:ectonucleotide pyrophosphatase/phosphodiesterase [Dyella nitratireducens]GGA37977.1 alkaline phosphatase family protein [Dyella nitratireducens]GLQ40250.1 alkaline phosphatase family protein [Dyella nitratireducens]
MRKLLAFVLALASIQLAHAQTSPNDGTAATHGPIVVLITIDGFPARALKDPRLPMPTLRKLMQNGSYAQAMQPINPSVTWPNHTTLITGVNAGEHHVMANGLITFPQDGGVPEVKPWTPKDQLVHARTLYDALAEKGMSTGQVDWVAIYAAKNVQWAFAEAPDVDSPIAQDLIAKGLVTKEQVATFGDDSTPAWRDQVWTDAAIDILTRHTPNLLLFHLLQTDTLQHEYGALSPAAYAAYAYADTCIARLIEAARNAGLLDRITFVIASDHGFTDYTHAIHPNVALVQQGLLHREKGSYRGDVWIQPEGGEASLYIRDNAKRAAWLPKLKADFEKLPGVAAVYTGSEANQLGIPVPGSTDQAPDLYLVAKPGYSFTDGTTGPLITDIEPARGAHGYLNSEPDMQALFIASGAHVRHGVTLGTISNLRVAPTIAKLLNVSLPAAKQAPLADLLQ